MDNTSALYLVPIIMPIAKALDINMIQLGVILVLNLSIGQVTPPWGQTCMWPRTSEGEIR